MTAAHQAHQPTEKLEPTSRSRPALGAIRRAACALAVAACALVGAGCSKRHDSVTQIAARDYPPESCPPEVFFAPAQPSRPYQQIALIEVLGLAWDSTADLVAHVQEKARLVGAHAVVGLEKSHKQRYYGDDTPFAERQPEDAYDAPYLTGLAVRYADGAPPRTCSAPPPATEVPSSTGR
jgi:hypothetical protein